MRHEASRRYAGHVHALTASAGGAHSSRGARGGLEKVTRKGCRGCLPRLPQPLTSQDPCEEGGAQLQLFFLHCEDGGLRTQYLRSLRQLRRNVT